MKQFGADALYCVFITDSAGDWLVLQSHQVFSSGTVNLIAMSTCTIKQKVKKKSNALNMCSEASVPVRRFNDLCRQWWMPSLGHQAGRFVLISFVGKIELAGFVCCVTELWHTYSDLVRYSSFRLIECFPPCALWLLIRIISRLLLIWILKGVLLFWLTCCLHLEIMLITFTTSWDRVGILN